MSEHQTRYSMFDHRTRHRRRRRTRCGVGVGLDARRPSTGLDARRRRRLDARHLGCQHLPEADHQLWVAKTTLSGVKGWRDANKRMISRCSLCSAKRSDSNKRMKSCVHKYQHRALLKVDTLKANKHFKTN
ncbi:hypothetical protein AAG906_006885 [Vitis piasezkii]